MRSAGVVMAVAAVLAGIVVARLEHEAETAGDPGGSAPRPAVTDAPGARPEPSALGAGSPGEARDGDPRRHDVTASPAVSLPADELRRRREHVADLLATQRFREAAAAAGALIAALEAQGVARSDEELAGVRRLAAKANVFALLVDGIDRAGTPPLASQVRLANGSTIAAVRAEKEGDRYTLELPGGISYRPRAEEVLEIRRMSEEEHRDFVTREWQRLRRRLEKIEDPVELYVRGVERCYRDGLDDEGLALLERLLAMPGARKIPRRFAGADAAGAERDWEIAAGRAPEAGPPRAADRPARTGDDQTDGTNGTAESPASPGATLTRVRSLRDDARKLYRSGFPREGHKGDPRALREARERLEEAFTLIETLDPSEEVEALRLDLGQILGDVVRVSPF